ncbi:hypothetical protein CCZ28_03965 [Pseudomonas oryzihabitans]|nr:hypothetical protein CCZ28_03965 [Pseudomonas psychrotolerans]
MDSLSRIPNPIIDYAFRNGAKAAGAVNETAGSIRGVNPCFPEAGPTHNCINCSIATDATLAENPASALPIKSTDGVQAAATVAANAMANNYLRHH